MINQTILVTEVGANVTGKIAQQEDGISSSILFVIQKIFEVLTVTGQNYGFWRFLIVLFAIIGFFAILSAIGNKIFSVIALLFKIFVIIPLVIVTGFVNRKKRKQRLSEWGEIKEDFKKNSKKIKKRYWVLWIFLKIVLPLLIIIIGVIILT